MPQNSAAALASGLSATLIGCRDEFSRRHCRPQMEQHVSCLSLRGTSPENGYVCGAIS
jgi:hypothetical protein